MLFVNRNNKPKHGKSKSLFNIIIFFRVIFLIIIIISSIEIIIWFLGNKQNKTILKELAKENIVTVDKIENEINIDFDKLKEINSDVVGYIKLDNPKIEYPVVQTKDNDYYLKHNLKKEYNQAGWIFLDYRNEINSSNKNIIIYGHNMQNNSMFGQLKDVLTPEWYNNEENKIITFITENGIETYEFFSVYEIEIEEYYLQTDFKDTKEYEKFINTIKNRSIKDFGINVTVSDNILTLSTCGNNSKYRIVIHAKKQEEKNKTINIEK